MTPFRIATGYVPGIIGRVAELHGIYYAEHWQFGSFFEAKVATDLSAFMDRYQEDWDCIWTISNHQTVEGSITIDGSSGDRKAAHLRWFIMSDRLQGSGAGNALMESAMSFCKERGFERVYLWTFEGLTAARHLYEKCGFRLVEEHSGSQWGAVVKEQRFEAEIR